MFQLGSFGCVSELDVSVYELDAAALAADALRLEIRKKHKIFVLALRRLRLVSHRGRGECVDEFWRRASVCVCDSSFVTIPRIP